MADVYFKCTPPVFERYASILDRCADAFQREDVAGVENYMDMLKALPNFPRYNPDVDHVKPVITDYDGEVVTGKRALFLINEYRMQQRGLELPGLPH